jgi:hypothetical protein
LFHEQQCHRRSTLNRSGQREDRWTSLKRGQSRTVSYCTKTRGLLLAWRSGATITGDLSRWDEGIFEQVLGRIEDGTYSKVYPSLQKFARILYARQIKGVIREDSLSDNNHQFIRQPPTGVGVDTPLPFERVFALLKLFIACLVVKNEILPERFSTLAEFANLFGNHPLAQVLTKLSQSGKAFA